MDIYDSRYFAINKKFLSFFGIWPHQNYIQKQFLRGLTTTAALLILLPQMLRVYLHLKDDLDIILEHTGMIIIYSSILMKLVTSIVHEKKLERLYVKIGKNFQTINDKEERQVLDDYSEKGRMVTIFYIGYIFSTLVAFYSLCAAPIVLNKMEFFNVSLDRMFIMGGDFFVDRNEYYTQIFIYDAITVCMCVPLMCAFDSMYFVCVQHCLGLFAIINFTEILEATYSSILFIFMGMNMLFLSFVCVLVLVNLDKIMLFIRYFSIMIGALIHLFLLSWPGQELIDHSTSISEDAYTNEWYDLSIESQKLLKLVILRCIKPCQLTAGKIFVMGFENFAVIIKTSMSYMTMFTSFR